MLRKTIRLENNFLVIRKYFNIIIYLFLLLFFTHPNKQKEISLLPFYIYPSKQHIFYSISFPIHIDFF